MNWILHLYLLILILMKGRQKEISRISPHGKSEARNCLLVSPKVNVELNPKENMALLMRTFTFRNSVGFQVNDINQTVSRFLKVKTTKG